MKGKLWFLILGFLMLFNANPVWADGDFYVVVAGGGVGTKITKVPYTITQEGFYYLGQNLYSDGNGIQVNASNVTIDLMGFCLAGPGRDNASNPLGITFGNNVRNVEIRNGTIRGFDMGIGNDINDTINDLRIINARMLFNGYGFWKNGYTLLIKGCTIEDNYDGISIGDGSGTISNNMVNYHAGFGICLGNGVWTVTGNTLSNALVVLALWNPIAAESGMNGSIIGNTISYGSGQVGMYLPVNEARKILVSQNTLAGAGTAVHGGHAKIFYVGNVGLTNTNGFLAP